MWITEDLDSALKFPFRKVDLDKRSYFKTAFSLKVPSYPFLKGEDSDFERQWGTICTQAEVMVQYNLVFVQSYMPSNYTASPP